MEMGSPELTRIERMALRVGRLFNENAVPKRFQKIWIDNFAKPFVRSTISRRTLAHGVDKLHALNPPGGVVLAANHRSFFDQWVATLVLKDASVSWCRDVYYPVRSNFFYDSALGVAINLVLGAGAMYPPIYRDQAKSAFNKDALQRLHSVLAKPGVMVGVHPEGTRGKGPDPYELLPAQPGMGEIILKSKSVVIPLFINGLSNDFVGDARFNYDDDARRTNPLILVYGDPVDYSDYAAKKPRVALYKRTSDRVRLAIIEQAAIEKELRAACLNGEIADDDPRWLHNIRRS